MTKVYRIDEETIKKMQELRKEGVQVPFIAERMGVSTSTVSKFTRKKYMEAHNEYQEN